MELHMKLMVVLLVVHHTMLLVVVMELRMSLKVVEHRKMWMDLKMEVEDMMAELVKVVKVEVQL